MLHIFDLDGTLAAQDSTELLPGVAEWFAAHPSNPCAIATNQGGVGLRRWMEGAGFGEPGKYPTQAEVEDRVTTLALSLFHEDRARLPVYIAFAYQAKSGKWSPIPPEGQGDPRWNPDWRKPAPGMIVQAMSDANISDPAQVLMVGDSEADQQAAKAAGVGFRWAWEFFESPSRIRPSKPKTPVPVRIGIDGYILWATFPSAYDPLIAAAKASAMKWDETRRRWWRQITRWSGPLDDRLVELGVRLLAANLTVEAPSPVIRERIARQEFQPERTRWIQKRTTGHYAGWFVVQWSREESFARHLRTLPGAKVKPWRAFLPPDYYAEVLDFAQAHDFRLSDGAQELVEAGNAAYESAYVVDFTAPSTKQPIAPVREELEAAEFGIDEELLDDLADNDSTL